MKADGDRFIDITDYDQVIARVRAIVAHRVGDVPCSHSPNRIAMHPSPFDDKGTERFARIDALDVMSRRVDFDDIRRKWEAERTDT